MLPALLIVAVIFACFGGYVANQKGRDVGEGIMLGLLFGPLGVVVVALLPSKAKSAQDPTMPTGKMACSFCGQQWDASTMTNGLCPKCRRVREVALRSRAESDGQTAAQSQTQPAPATKRPSRIGAPLRPC